MANQESQTEVAQNNPKSEHKKGTPPAKPARQPDIGPILKKHKYEFTNPIDHIQIGAAQKNAATLILNATKFDPELLKVRSTDLKIVMLHVDNVPSTMGDIAADQVRSGVKLEFKVPSMASKVGFHTFTIRPSDGGPVRGGLVIIDPNWAKAEVNPGERGAHRVVAEISGFYTVDLDRSQQSLTKRPGPSSNDGEIFRKTEASVQRIIKNLETGQLPCPTHDKRQMILGLNRALNEYKLQIGGS